MKHESLEDRLVVRLKQEFPDLNFKQVQLNTKGWDHDVLILDNSFIVRFSKEKLDPKNFEREIRFLDEFRKISNLRIPKYTLISRDKTFGGYEMILGEELTPEKFQTLSSERRQDFVHQIAAFITKLHTIPLESAKDFGFEQYKSWDSELKEKEKWFQDEFYPKMSSSLTLEENTFIQNFVLSFCRSQHSVQPVIGHYDLSHDHIIMAPDGSISGIIDFGDINIGDPAHEFNGFADYDRNLPEQIYELYGGPKDLAFLKRCHDHYIHRWIYLLYDGRVRRKNEELFREARSKLHEIMNTK